MGDDLLHLEPPEFNANLIFKKKKKPSSETPGLIFEQISGYHDPLKLTHEMNRHPPGFGQRLMELGGLVDSSPEHSWKIGNFVTCQPFNNHDVSESCLQENQL